MISEAGHRKKHVVSNRNISAACLRRGFEKIVRAVQKCVKILDSETKILMIAISTGLDIMDYSRCGTNKHRKTGSTAMADPPKYADT